MKIIKFLMLFCIGALFVASNAIGQANPTPSLLPVNAGGIVAVGATMDIKLTISNTLGGNIIASKLRPVITVPSIVTLLPNAQQTGLPAGWVIVSNAAGQIRVCNGSDVIGGFETRDIIIKVQGTTIGGPDPTAVTLFYGGATCAVSGPQPNGNDPADDGASSSVTVIAAPACALTLSAASGTIACNSGTTTLTATPGSANGAVEYSITGGAPFQAGNTFTVPAGTYTVTAREAGTPACTATSTAVIVAQPTAVAASASVTTPIATAGGTGTITVSATGGTGTKTFTVTGGNTSGATSGVFSGLVAGTYTFTATDANSCTGTSTVTINNPAACIITGVTATAGSILCSGGTTSITAVATPAGTYEYNLNGGAFQASATFTNVAGGSYTVVAREAGNTVCSATSTVVTVTAPAAVSVSAAVTSPIAAPGGTGTITVSATGGTGTKTYVISSGTTVNNTGAASGVFTGLLAGSYTFTATDANACTAVSAATTLANPGIANADPAVGQMYFTTTSGAAQSANSLLLAPSLAVYDINIPFYNRNQVNVIPNGTINFRVNLGSKLVVNPGFNLATAPLATYFSFAQSLIGGNVIITGTQIATIPADFDAIATFRVKGDSACRSNVVSNIIITNVLQTLADDDLQNNQATLQYTLPITLGKTQVNVTCNGLNNGIINLTVSSGTSVSTTRTGGGYTNTTGVASGSNNFTLSNLAPGTYTIVASAASDASLSSCSQSITVIITEPTVLAIPAANVGSTNIICFGTSNGTITATATGGTAPYTYSISPAANTTGAISGIFTGLPAGSYVVTVTDNNGCTANPSSAIVITQPVGGIPDITLGSDVTGSLFTTPGVSQTIVYNIAEIGGNAAVGDTLRINKVNGFTINFNPTLFSTIVGGTTYALDNPRWKIDNSNPAFVSIILTDPGNASAPGTLLCNTLVRVSVTLTRNTSDISTFTLSARLRKANGEVNLTNNLNSIIFAAD